MMPLTTHDDATTAPTADLVVIDLLDVPARDLDALAFMCRCRTAASPAPASASS
jgi:hypothetical protein